ncbi:sulfotransferase family protein [Cyanobium sp. LEGE 06143]|uniref:sulfotransferase family protein n=1 Tax=unclassified Cyanobium TaxID=2627006 RepID=UPI00187FFFBB|nr:MULTISPECIES: sulfotransferase family protein [unclassified Cyanobium]MBE9154400.1 sulfotransferase family protein [Cyanobium sp. LEGE 06113]MBE9173585.1 sulfotransferase family protein [Cyanobium sp. LEGE 06143]
MAASDHHFLHLPGHHLLYGRVPKAANSSVKAALTRLIRPELQRNRHGLGQRLLRALQPHRSWQSLSSQVDQFWDLLPSSIARPVDRATARQLRAHCFSFAVVRNPFDRLLSAYNNKVIENPSCTARLRAIGVERGMALPQFIERLCAADSAALDVHVLPQAEILCLDAEPLPTWVAYAESLELHWPFLVQRARRAGVPGLMRQLPDKNSRRQGQSTDLEQLLAQPQLVQLLRQRYADDFSFFYPWLLEGNLTVAQVRQGGPRRPRHFVPAQ